MRARHSRRRPPAWFRPEARYQVVPGHRLELVIEEPRIRLADLGRVTVILMVGLPIGMVVGAVLIGFGLIAFGGE